MSEVKLGYTKGLEAEAALQLAQAMLDAPMSEIELLPDFVKPAPGQYLVNSVVNCEVVQYEATSEKPADIGIKLTFELGTAIELRKFPGVAPSDLPEGAAPPEGSLVGFQFRGPLGIQRFNKIFQDVVQKVDPNIRTRDLVEGLNTGNITGLAVDIGQRADREKQELDPATNQLVPVTYAELVSVVMA